MKEILNLIITPSEEVYRISRRQSSSRGLYVLLTASFSSVIAVGLVAGVPGNAAAFMLTWGVILRAGLCALFILSASALYHFFASMIGGSGNAGKTLSGMFYTSAPFCFLAPAALISNYWGGGFLFFIFFLAAALFAAFLHFKVIAYFYGLPNSRAAVVFLAPWIIFSTAAVFTMGVLSLGFMAAAL